MRRSVAAKQTPTYSAVPATTAASFTRTPRGTGVGLPNPKKHDTIARKTIQLRTTSYVGPAVQPAGNHQTAVMVKESMLNPAETTHSERKVSPSESPPDPPPDLRKDTKHVMAISDDMLWCVWSSAGIYRALKIVPIECFVFFLASPWLTDSTQDKPKTAHNRGIPTVGEEYV